MDINKNQQINTFSKGMNTDVANSFIPADQYRLAENLRYTKNGDSGSLSTVEGYKQIEYNIDGTDITVSHILATTQIRDIGIIVFIDSQNNVYICKFDKDDTDDWQTSMHIVFGPCTDSEWNENTKLSLVANWESDNNVKLYIADGIHQLLSFNIFGTVYTSITDLNAYIATDLHQPAAEISSQAGNIKAGVVQYCYRLYNQNAQATSLSPLSVPISITKDNIGIAYDELSNIATDINITKNDSFNRIILYRILYEQYQQQPTVDVVYDGPASGTFFSFTDTGRIERNISPAELLAIGSMVQFKPAVIERKNNYLFAANVKYQQDDIDYIFEHSGFKLSHHLYQSQVDSYTIDRKNTIVSGTFQKSLRRGEVYRYGVIYYTNTGQKSSVMDIVDIDLANATFEYPTWEIVNGNYKIHPIGVSFSLDFSEISPGETYYKACSLISGYEIVRCERTYEDKRNLYQGILGTTVAQDDDDNGDYQYYTPGFMSTVNYKIVSTRQNHNNTIFRTAFAESIPYEDKLVMYAFPELLYNREETQNVLKRYKNNIRFDITSQYTGSFKNSNDLSFFNDERYLTLVTNQRGDVTSIPEGSHDNLSGTFLLVHARYFASLDDLKSGIPLRIEEGPNETRVTQIIENDLYPVATINNNVYSGNASSYKIDDIKIADSPDYNTYSNGETVRFKDDVQIVNNLQFINWTPNVVMERKGDTNPFKDTMHFAEADSYWKGYIDDEPDTVPVSNPETYNLQPGYPISTGGTCIVAYLEKDLPHLYIDNAAPNDPENGEKICKTLPIIIANVTKNATPYGTNQYNSVFYSHGCYRDVNIEIGRHNPIEFPIYVFDGDCYIGIFEYNAAHCWDSAYYRATMMNTTYYVPIESDINLFYTHGDLKSRNNSSGRSYLIQDKAVIYHEYNQRKDAYLYNMAYSTEPNLMSYTKTEYTPYQSDTFDTRVLYSEQKENGELIDNWLQFKSANFIDIDTRYGKITNLRLFKDYLLYWQTDATGVLSVNERTILQDANEHNIILGNGDVLQRYDYITTQYGMREGDFSDTQSGTALYWWDSNKKDIVMYQGGQQVQPLKKVKSVSKYIDDRDGRDNPMLSYDNDHNEVICNVLSDNKSIIYGELMQQFMSVYDYDFNHKIQFNDRLLLFTNTNMYKWNSVGSVQKNPRFIYVVNDNCTFPKSFDIMTFGGKFGDGPDFKLRFTSQLNMDSGLLESKYQGYDWNIIHTGTSEPDTISIITDKEGDYRMAIPRGAYIENGPKKYGSRMRGKWMQCEIDSNSADFQLDYIITKYRMSWS